MQTNPMQLSEDLKGVPLQALMQYAQGSNPMVPQWMALTEMSRRKALQQAAQPQQPAGPQPTVKDQLVQQSGLDALAQQRQTGMQQLLGGAPAMARGGVVAFQAGGGTWAAEPGAQMGIYKQELRQYEAELLAAQQANDFQKVRELQPIVESLRRRVEAGPENVRTYETPAPPGATRPRPEDTDFVAILTDRLKDATARVASAPDAAARNRALVDVDSIKQEFRLLKKDVPAVAAAASGPIIGAQQASQIPGYGGAVPAAQAPDFAERLRQAVGIPQGVTRNVTNTLNAVPGLGGPLGDLSRSASGAGPISRGIRGLVAGTRGLSAANGIADMSPDDVVVAANALQAPPTAEAPKIGSREALPEPAGAAILGVRPDPAPGAAPEPGLARRDIKPEDYLTPEAQELLKYKPQTVEERLAEEAARRPKNTLPEMYDTALREMAARRAEAGKSGGLDDIIKVLAGAKKGYGGMAEAYGGMQEGRKAAIDKLREQEMALQFKKAEAQQAYENGDFERFKKLRDEFQQDTLKLLSAKAKLTQDARETYGKDLTEREKLGETTALRREATAQREQAARQGSAVRLAANQDAAVAKWRSTIEYTDLSAKLLSKDPAVAKAARTAIDTREREEREKARKAFLASEGTLQSGQSGAFEVLRKTPP